MKKWSLFFKVSTLVGLVVLMMIPVAMIMNVIDERSYYRHDVIRQITDSAGGEQTILGPFVVQPYREIKQSANGDNYYTSRKYKFTLPDDLTIRGDMDVEKRQVSIYETQIYKGNFTFEGRLPAITMEGLINENIILDEPYLVVAVTDSRGIISVPKLQLEQQALSVEPFANGDVEGVEPSTRAVVKSEATETIVPKRVIASFQAGVSGNHDLRGIHAFLPESFLTSQKPINFKFSMVLQGSQSLSVIPIGRNSSFDLKANWPHPSFIGSYLPLEKTIDQNGFTAHWQSSWFANNLNDVFNRYSGGERKLSLDRFSGFDIKLVELVDEYQLNMRSVKYSILFIGLTFVAFFLFEVLKDLRIHPLQYLLVGVSLALFYLLLLALSEQIGFTLAYWIAAVASCGLISFYLSAVLRGLLRGLIFGAGLLVLYGVLFGLLQSENNALMLGSLLLFLVVAIIMVLTRHIDWYRLSSGSGGGVSEVDEMKHQEIVDEIDRKSCRLWK